MQAPGDILMLTVLVRELHNNYPDHYNVGVITPYPEITYNNPRISNVIKLMERKAPIIDLTYVKAKDESVYTGQHFSDGFIENAEELLNIKISKTSMYPEIYLTDEEKDREKVLSRYGISGKFWLFNAGIKTDIPLKMYPHFYWQKIIDECCKNEIQIIQVGSSAHIHPEFGNARSLVGKTEDLRKYLALCYHAEGHIGAISLQMHVMAAFRKPCIVLAGGRENPLWEMYPNHQFLHSVGYLNCCSEGGCWRSQRNECSYLVGYPSYPLCMVMINPQRVVDAIINYERGNGKGKK